MGPPLAIQRRFLHHPHPGASCPISRPAPFRVSSSRGTTRSLPRGWRSKSRSHAAERFRKRTFAGRDLQAPGWGAVRDIIQRVSFTRAQQGFSPSETATFVLALKRPLFDALRAGSGQETETLADNTWAVTELLDKLALLSMEAYMRTREELIARQQQDMLELSTPVIKLWDGVLALPMIGTLDSSRTQVVMESLLQRIVETGADVAILDITGVPTVDTLTAQHLIKTVTAARLMGAECIISGIRPQIAQTIVHLGVDLGDIVTKATLADAFKLALARNGMGVVKVKTAAAPALGVPSLLR
jgi:rsbT co-antagonist protein RsbR